jgi:hypothetical protein
MWQNGNELQIFTQISFFENSLTFTFSLIITYNLSPAIFPVLFPVCKHHTIGPGCHFCLVQCLFMSLYVSIFFFKSWLPVQAILFWMFLSHFSYGVLLAYAFPVTDVLVNSPFCFTGVSCPACSGLFFFHVVQKYVFWYIFSNAYWVSQVY